MWCSEISSGTGFSLWDFVVPSHQLSAKQNSQAEACSTRLRCGALCGTGFSLWDFVVPSHQHRAKQNSQAEACSTRLRCGALCGTGFSLWDFVVPSHLHRAKQNSQAEACSTKGCATALAILFLFISLPARATTYFVAAAGNDSNSGIDSGHPWQTISKVNGAVFSAGDSVLFNRGDAWYGTSLNV